MKILVLHGPNLNLLGEREEKYYGASTFSSINKALKEKAKELKVEILIFQSNHEGELIDIIQKHRGKVDGILINAGALSHYGYSLRDALLDTKLPVVTVHLSNIYKRQEEFRHKDILSDIAVGGIYGFKEQSYLLGLQALVNYLKGQG